MTRILIVDDAEKIRTDLCQQLSENGFDVVAAANGEEALSLLDNDTQIKVIITDVHMPVMDGITMIEKIRQQPSNTRIKIIVSTTQSNAEYRERCKPLKLSGWALKPLQLTAILPVLKKLLAQS